jgi:tyrosyl-tRNA synthetase
MPSAVLCIFQPVIVARASRKGSHNFFLELLVGELDSGRHPIRKFDDSATAYIPLVFEVPRFETIPELAPERLRETNSATLLASMAGTSSPAFVLSRGRICHRCLRAQARGPVGSQWRPIHLSVLAKRAKAAKAWEEYAKQIENGTQKNPWDMLEERGYVKDVAG